MKINYFENPITINSEKLNNLISNINDEFINAFMIFNSEQKQGIYGSESYGRRRIVELTHELDLFNAMTGRKFKYRSDGVYE